MNSSIKFNGQDIALDGNGYLVDHTEWNDAVAEKIAEQENIELTAEHWQVVRFVRQFYEEYETSPAIRVLVKSLSAKFGPDVGNSRYVQRLFPKGPAKQATKIAGLPKPAKCL